MMPELRLKKGRKKYIHSTCIFARRLVLRTCFRHDLLRARHAFRGNGTLSLLWKNVLYPIYYEGLGGVVQYYVSGTYVVVPNIRMQCTRSTTDAKAERYYLLTF